VAGRASIVGAAETSVGKVRDHNEDSHFIDPEAGIFVVCDGMGGHAAGEVASAIAVQTVRERWSSDAMTTVADHWLAKGTPEAHKQLLAAVTDGVIAAHDAILAEGQSDRTKSGMGTTLVGGMVVGGEMVFAHCGDSRAYLVRDGIAMQLTEDHTLLARLLAAGVDVDTDGEGSRFKSMLTNALGIGHECKASTFVVPLADGDRFLLCSDGITEYLQEHEIGEVLGKAPSPARAAQKLVEIALERGGGDNATALVVRVLEAGEVSRPSELLRRENDAINSCPLWAKVNPQQRLRALRIALPRDHAAGEKVPAHTLGDRVAWIIIEGTLEQEGELRGPGSLLYPESLLSDRPLPDRDSLAVAKTEVRALALRSDDFRELCEDDADLAEHLLASLGDEIGKRAQPRKIVVGAGSAADGRGSTDPGGHRAVSDADARASTESDSTRAPTATGAARAATDPPPLPEIPTPVARPPAPAAANPMRTHPRGSTPPSGKSLIAPAAETGAAFDAAMEKITVDTGWAELPDEDASDEHERATVPVSKVAESESEPETEIIVEAEPPPAPAAVAKRPPDSEPEISITALADAAGDPSSDEPSEIEMTIEDDSARVVEVVKDTSSQTITMTIDEPPEPEIVVVQPAAESKRAKSQTDA